MSYCSATVNGNDTVEAAYYPEQNTAVAHAPAAKKEAKPKASLLIGYMNIHLTFVHWGEAFLFASSDPFCVSGCRR